MQELNVGRQCGTMLTDRCGPTEEHLPCETMRAVPGQLHLQRSEIIARQSVGYGEVTIVVCHAASNANLQMPANPATA